MSATKRPLPTVIRIRVERVDPLAGTAATEDGATLAFEGWMELIRAVAELLGAAGSSRSAAHRDLAGR